MKLFLVEGLHKLVEVFHERMCPVRCLCPFLGHKRLFFKKNRGQKFDGEVTLREQTREAQALETTPAKDAVPLCGWTAILKFWITVEGSTPSAIMYVIVTCMICDTYAVS